MIQRLADLLALLVKVRRGLPLVKAALGRDLEALPTRHVVTQHPFESLDDAVHGSQETLLFELVVEGRLGNVGADHVRVDGVHSDLFFWQIFAERADEAGDGTLG